MITQYGNVEYNSIGEHLILLASTKKQVTVDICGEEFTALEAEFRKPSDRKGIEISVSRLSRNAEDVIYVEIPNHFDEVYVVPRTLRTSGARGGSIAYLFVLPQGTYIVNMYADVLLDCIIGNGVAIHQNGRISVPIKMASAGSIVPINIELNTSKNKIKKVSKKDLVVGKVYENSRTKYIYLGMFGDDPLFISTQYEFGMKYNVTKLKQSNGNVVQYSQDIRIRHTERASEMVYVNFYKGYVSISSKYELAGSNYYKFVHDKSIPTLYETDKSIGNEVVSILLDHATGRVTVDANDLTVGMLK